MFADYPRTNLFFYWKGWIGLPEHLQREGWDIRHSKQTDSYRDIIDYHFYLTHRQSSLIFQAKRSVSRILHMTMPRNNSIEFFDMYGPLPVEMDAATKIIAYHTGLYNPVGITYPEVDFNPMAIATAYKNIGSDGVSTVLTRELFYPRQSQDIIIPESSTEELLDLILKRQAPKQAEIRERIRKEESRHELARIITLAS